MLRDTIYKFLILVSLNKENPTLTDMLSNEANTSPSMSAHFPIQIDNVNS